MSSVNICRDLQEFGQGHCEFLFNMVGLYNEMGRLILQVKKDLLSSLCKASSIGNVALRTIGVGKVSGNII